MKKKSFVNFHQMRKNKAVYSDRDKREHIPSAVRKRVLERFDGLCGYCSIKARRLCIDHVNPHVVSRDNSEENLMPCCYECNYLKGIFDLEEFRREVSMQIIRAYKYSVNYRTALRYFQIIENPSPIIFYFERMKK